MVLREEASKILRNVKYAAKGAASLKEVVYKNKTRQTSVNFKKKISAGLHDSPEQFTVKNMPFLIILNLFLFIY